ncbi:MAG: ABC transporter ATP-binding protein [Acidimicrobiia bacterium]
MKVASGFAHVEADAVTKVFGSRKADRLVAVDRVTLAVEAGRRVGIVGESGSGKSTLARMLVGLDAPTSGTILFDGNGLPTLSRADMTGFRRAVQFVAQDTSSSFDPRRTLRDAVRTPAQRLLGLDRRAADARVEETFELLGLPLELADRIPGDVSGGQRQRVALARALVVQPRILVCDEVVSALDVSVQGSILNLLKRYCAEHDAGLVFVSHGLPATAFIAEELVVMRHGTIVEQGTTAQVLHEPGHDYTRLLLRAHSGRPDADEAAEIIEGDLVPAGADA